MTADDELQQGFARTFGSFRRLNLATLGQTFAFGFAFHLQPAIKIGKVLIGLQRA